MRHTGIRAQLIALFLIFPMLISSGAQAAELFAQPSPKLTVSGHYLPEDGINLVRLDVKIPDGFYLYHFALGDPRVMAQPLRLSLAGGVQPTFLAFSAPKTKQESIYGYAEKTANIFVHEKELTIWLRIPATIPAAPPPKITLDGQICSANKCISVTFSIALPPTTDFGTFTDMPQENQLAVLYPAPSEKTADAPSIQDTATQDVAEDYAAIVLPEFRIQNPPAELNYPLWLALAFVAGIILNLMPCVLPVLSLKLMSFAAHAHNSHAREVRLSLFFSLGVVTVFMALATAAVLLGLQWGEQFQSEAFNIAAVTLIFVFALSFFGVYEFGLPGAASSGLSEFGRAHDEGYSGAFITGVVATVMATPCSGPFLGAVLAWAVGQPGIVVFSVFAATGLGMAAPYVALSASKRLRGLLPKPGNWMDGLKVGMGFMLLAMALYFMLYIDAENLLYTNALLLFAAGSCLMLGRYSTPLRGGGVRWLARIGALVILLGGAYLLFGIIKPSLANASAGRGLAAADFDYARFNDDLNAGKNILIKFTADWCTNCKYNEYVVFSSKEVQTALRARDVVVYRADITDDSPMTRLIKRLMNALGGYALPYAALFPADRPHEPLVLPDVLGKEQVVRAVEALPAPR